MDKGKIKKCTDIYPIAISLTGVPKTGDKYLFRKSLDHDGGKTDMNSLSNDARLALQRAYDAIAPYKGELSDDFVASFEKSMEVKAEVPANVAELIKANSLSAEVVEIIKGMSTNVEELSKALKDERERNAAKAKELIKKSYDDLAEELSLLPVEKTELSDLMFVLRTEHGDAVTERVEQVVRKCHASIKEGMPQTATGVDVGTAGADSGSGEAYRDAVLARVAKDFGDKASKMDIVKTMNIVKSEDPEGYNDFNEKVKTGQIANII